MDNRPAKLRRTERASDVSEAGAASASINDVIMPEIICAILPMPFHIEHAATVIACTHVCKLWNGIMRARLPPQHAQSDIAIQRAATIGDVKTLAWLHARGYRYAPHAGCVINLGAASEKLQMNRSESSSGAVYRFASKYGQYRVIGWALKERIPIKPWLNIALTYAIARDDVCIMATLRGADADYGALFVEKVVRGDLAVAAVILKYFKPKFDRERLSCDVARTGKIDRIEWLAQQKLFVADSDTITALLKSDLDEIPMSTVARLHALGAKFNIENIMLAAAGGHIDILKYAHVHGAPWSQSVCELGWKYHESDGDAEKVMRFAHGLDGPCGLGCDVFGKYVEWFRLRRV